MKKLEKRIEIDFHFDWTYGVEIKKIKEDLDKLESLGATDIDIEVEENYGSHTVSISAFCIRLETDEEAKTRIKEEKNRKELIKNKELELLAQLKLKYGQ